MGWKDFGIEKQEICQGQGFYYFLKEIPNTDNTTISGKFLSKVYEGPFKDTGKWCKDFENYAKSEGLKVNKRNSGPLTQRI